jgi:hypothetical protein
LPPPKTTGWIGYCACPALVHSALTKIAAITRMVAFIGDSFRLCLPVAADTDVVRRCYNLIGPD